MRQIEHVGRSGARPGGNEAAVGAGRRRPHVPDQPARADQATAEPGARRAGVDLDVVGADRQEHRNVRRYVAPDDFFDQLRALNLGVARQGFVAHRIIVGQEPRPAGLRTRLSEPARRAQPIDQRLGPECRRQQNQPAKHRVGTRRGCQGMMDREGGAEPESDQHDLLGLALKARDRVPGRLDPLPVIHLQQVARYRAMSRQQDRAHQITVVRKRAGDVAHLIGRAAEVMEQQRRPGVTSARAGPAASALRYQLERRPILDHVGLEWPFDARVGVGDHRLGSGPVRGEVGRGQREGTSRRRVPRRHFARRRAPRQGQHERRAGCPPDECLGADLSHPLCASLADALRRGHHPMLQPAMHLVGAGSSRAALSGLDAAAPSGRIGGGAAQRRNRAATWSARDRRTAA